MIKIIIITFLKRFQLFVDYFYNIFFPAMSGVITIFSKISALITIFPEISAVIIIADRLSFKRSFTRLYNTIIATVRRFGL